MRLAEEGLLASYRPSTAEDVPETSYGVSPARYDEQVLARDPNNTQASRGLAQLPDQVNNEIVQLRNKKSWTGARNLSGAAKDAFPGDPRFGRDGGGSRSPERSSLVPACSCLWWPPPPLP